jgi:tetratricopeptide (TPR) repeat protein
MEMSSPSESTIIRARQIPALFYKYRNALVCLLILSAVFTAYHQSLDNDFVAFDDDKLILQNPHIQTGLSWENIKWAFTTNHFSNWHPLTWLSFMLDYELYGLEPGGYHLTALLLHALNSIILYFALLRLTAARPLRNTADPQMTWEIALPAAVALLFAVHPLNVETVAWVSERKGVLSTLFWMLTLWSYAGYARRPSVKTYLPVMAFMSLGLMAKQMLVTLPLVLLLLDYWPLGRFGTGQNGRAEEYPTQEGQAREEQARERREGQAREGRTLAGLHRGAWAGLRDSGIPWLVLEKLPLFALSIISAVVIFLLQRGSGLVSDTESFPLKYRLPNVLNSYVEYIRKLFLPNDLACFYPYVDIPLWRAAFCALLLAAITAAAVYSRKQKYLLTGWLWYVVTLIPVAGFVQTGTQSMADRYAYVTTVGLFIAAAWGAADSTAGRPGRKIAAVLCLAVLITSFTAYTRAQVRYWKNYAALFSHAARVTEGNDVAYIAMGNIMFQMGRSDKALVFFSEALKYRPQKPSIHLALGATLLRLDKPLEAANHFAAAIRLRKDYVEAFNGMGDALLALDRSPEALAFYKKAVSLKPDDPVSYNGMGTAFLKMGDLANAEDCFKKAVKFAPATVAYYENLQTVRRVGRGQVGRSVE